MPSLFKTRWNRMLRLRSVKHCHTLRSLYRSVRAVQWCRLQRGPSLSGGCTWWIGIGDWHPSVSAGSIEVSRYCCSVFSANGGRSTNTASKYTVWTWLGWDKGLQPRASRRLPGRPLVRVTYVLRYLKSSLRSLLSIARDDHLRPRWRRRRATLADSSLIWRCIWRSYGVQRLSASDRAELSTQGLSTSAWINLESPQYQNLIAFKYRLSFCVT